MQPVSQWTVGSILENARNLAIFSSLVIAIWKFRGIWEVCKNFINKLSIVLDRVPRHMDAMENGMNELLNNHLSHLRADREVADAEVPENDISGHRAD